MSPKNGGEEEGDVALVGEEFFVGAAAEELWIGVHRDGGGGAGGVDYLFVVMWVGQRTQGIEEGGGVEKRGEGLPYSVPAQQKQLANI